MAKTVKCEAHSEYFPKEPEKRYTFEFNGLPDVCVRCQKAILGQQEDQQPSDPDTVVFVRVSPTLKSQLDKIARSSRRTRASVYREAFEIYLRHYGG